MQLAWSAKKRLPQSRPALTTSFRVGDAEGYITAGSYPDDGLGEIFLKVSKQGSTLSGIMDAFSIARLGRPAVRRAAGGLRLEVHQHEVRALGDDERPRHPVRVLASWTTCSAGWRSTTCPPKQRDALGIKSIEERKVEAQEKVGQLEAGPMDEPPPAPAAAAAPSPPTAPERIDLGPKQSARILRRAALLLVRVEDAAGRAPATCAEPAAAPAAARRPRRLARVSEEGTRVLGLHHVQLAMPPGEEEAASRFYGAILGLTQVAKPPELAPRGGVWFRDERIRGPPGRRGAVQAGAQGASGVPRPRTWTRSASGSRPPATG